VLGSNEFGRWIIVISRQSRRPAVELM